MDEKRQHALDMHKQWQGKIEINSRVPLHDKADLAVAYTPGVAEPCLVIKDDVDASYTYTRRGNLVAVITDGTAVLGLGDIGPEAGMPVMEGKCVLFKALGGVDAIPLCIRSKNVDEIVQTVSMIAGSFGGINLEDIAAPRCFEIERQLKAKLDIPVFHDDQHGTAVVALAGILNALKVVGKDLSEVKVVFSGSGAAGIATARLLVAAGMKHFIMTDSKGTAYRGRDRMSADLTELAEISNQEMLKGTLADALQGADVFIGVSAPRLVTQDMVKSMNKDAILLPMANPTPEIMPDEALAAGAAVVGSGRSDFPNQINNVLAFPGIFRGTLDVRARTINEEMKVAAAHAIASLVGDKLSPTYIIPDALDPRVAPEVAKAVAEAARKSGVARK